MVDEFLRCGVTDAVLSPGSRSTPLAMALAVAEARGEIVLHVRLDERSAGYLAVGIAKVTGVPAIVVTTSGTAAVNLHPAIVEADQSGIPLIAVTADRPPQLFGSVHVPPGSNGSRPILTIFDVSSVYTLCGTPLSSPMSPRKAASRTSGLSGAGKIEMPMPDPARAAVGRNNPLNPSDGEASGTLMTPVDVKLPSCGRNTTASSKTTAPVESRTMKLGA